MHCTPCNHNERLYSCILDAGDHLDSEELGAAVVVVGELEAERIVRDVGAGPRAEDEAKVREHEEERDVAAGRGGRRRAGAVGQRRRVVGWEVAGGDGAGEAFSELGAGGRGPEGRGAVDEMDARGRLHDGGAALEVADHVGRVAECEEEDEAERIEARDERAAAAEARAGIVGPLGDEEAEEEVERLGGRDERRLRRGGHL